MTVAFLAHAHRSYPVYQQSMPATAVAPVLAGPAPLAEPKCGYGRTPKSAPHIWLSKTVPLEYFDSVQVVSCGRGLSVG